MSSAPPVYPNEVVLTTLESDEIRALIRKCPAGSIRTLAVRAMEQGVPPTLEDASQLISRLSTDTVPNWSERALAAWLLGLAAYEPADRDAVAEWLSETVRDRVPFDGKGRSRLAAQRTVMLVLISIAATALASRSISMGGLVSSLLWRAVGCYIPCALATNAQCDKRMNIIRVQALRSLRRLRSPRGAMASLEAMYDGTRLRARGENAQVAVQAAFAAQASLPAFAASRVGFISGHHCSLLGRVVRSGSVELSLGALQVMGEMGDASCLQPLNWVAAKRREPELKEAAREAIGRLTERLERERMAKTLLRPTEAPADISSLLRPAAGSSVDTTSLVRPVEEQEIDAVSEG
jgi:hypothetical protein